MKRKNKARVGGAAVFFAAYFTGIVLTAVVPEGVWVALIALFMAAWVADIIDPVHA